MHVPKPSPGANRQITRVRAIQMNPYEVRVEVAANIPVGNSEFFTTYTIYGNGDVVVSNRFVPRERGLPDLPRLGMTMTLPREFDNVVWYGRGPHENYWDRNNGAAVGLYEAKVSDLYHPYIRPQETGNRTGVRWVALTNDEGSGLLAVGMPLLNVSAWHFTMEDLDPGEQKAQRHTFDVHPRDLVTLNLDYMQMGVGGDDSWGALPHPEYRIPAREYSYSFRLRPFSRADGTPIALSRTTYDTGQPGYRRRR